jgi:hypothetical protein
VDPRYSENKKKLKNKNKKNYLYLGLLLPLTAPDLPKKCGK